MSLLKINGEMSFGQVGYEAYAESTGGKTWDGREMPTWEEIVERTPKIATAWEAAATAIGLAHKAQARICCSKAWCLSHGNIGEKAVDRGELEADDEALPSTLRNDDR